MKVYMYIPLKQSLLLSHGEFRILEFPVLCVLQYQYYQYCWMKNTEASIIVCFTILVLPVLLDEEYWNSSIVCFTILVLPVLLDEEYWSFRYCAQINDSGIVNARYWYIQYCIYTILDFRYCNITKLVFLVLYSVTILVLTVL